MEIPKTCSHEWRLRSKGDFFDYFYCTYCLSEAKVEAQTERRGIVIFESELL